ncbi:MAG: RNA polymerase sigma factor [Candidatus Acidiferrales bacterium]
MAPRDSIPADDALVRRLRSGDEEAFAALYREHKTEIYRFALHMSGNHSIAEEVTQEAFLALIRDPERFDPTRGPVLAYLFGIARNHVRRAFERDRRILPSNGDRSLDDLPAPSPTAAEGDRSDAAERIERVRKAVLSLPASYREVVVLCDLQQKSYVYAAEQLDCPVGTIRSRLNRARALIMAKLSGTAVSRESGERGATREPSAFQRLRAGGRA